MSHVIGTFKDATQLVMRPKNGNSMSSDSRVVDLRSDTITRPTEAMYQLMCVAPLGDDGLDGDPTVRDLETLAASRLGKAAALFVASCTMANLLAVLVRTQRNERIIAEADSHILLSERGPFEFGGVQAVAVPGEAGAMKIGALQRVLTTASPATRTALLVVETSHNNAGGAVLPLEHLREVRTLAVQHDVPVHMDGARLMNAAVHLGVPAADIAQFADSVALCLSKGLSAPVGAILAGNPAFIARARSIRKALGGQQRQAGVVAAAGLEALTNMVRRLAEDHERAWRLSRGLNGLGGRIRATEPQTNIVQVDVSKTGLAPEVWVAQLAARSVLVRAWRGERLRCVTHRHIDNDQIDAAILAFSDVALSGTPTATICDP